MRYPAKYLEPLEFVFNAVAAPIQLLIISFRIFHIAASRDTGFATLATELSAVFFAIIPFIPDPCGVLQLGSEFRSGGVIADVSGGQDDFGSQPAQDINGHVELGIESTSGLPNRLILSSSGAVGVLMDFMVGAVVEHRLSLISADQLLFQKIEEACEGQPIEELIYGRPFSKFGGQRPPGRPVEHHIPKSIEVIIGDPGPASGMDYVVVSNSEFLDLIF